MPNRTKEKNKTNKQQKQQKETKWNGNKKRRNTRNIPGKKW